MANVLILDDDTKVVRIIEAFLTELDEGHRSRIFRSLSEFESLYFNPRALKGKSAPKESDLSSLPPAQKHELLGLETLTKTKALPGTMTFFINSSSGELLRTDPEIGAEETVLNMSREKIALGKKALENMILPSSKTAFDRIWQRPSDKGWLALLLGDGTVGLFEYTSENMSSLVQLTLRDQTHLVVKLQEEAKLANDSAEGDDEGLKLFSQIDLIIIKTTLLKGPIRTEVARLKRQIKTFGLQSGTQKTKIVLTKYEDDGVETSDLLDPLIDDVFFLPLDRLTFLQKLDILLSLPQKITPRFLFSQQTEMAVEIAKKTYIEKINDLGIAVRNPVPLVPGLLGHFYFSLPGLDEEFSVYAKAMHSEAHPEYPLEFLVYFSFQGIDRLTLSKFRSFFGQLTKYQTLKNDSREKFLFTGISDKTLAISGPHRKKGVMLLDETSAGLAHLANVVQSEIDELDLAGFFSFQRLIDVALTDDLNSFDHIPPIEKSDILADFWWLVDTKTGALVATAAIPDPEIKMAGITLGKIFAQPVSWKKLINQTNLDDALTEVAEMLLTQSEVIRLFKVVNNDGLPRIATFRFQAHAKGMRIDISIPTVQTISKTTSLEKMLPTWDLLIVHSRFLSSNPSLWLTNLQGRLNQRGLLPPGTPLQAIIVVEEEADLNMMNFKDERIRGVLLKPLELRSFLFQAAFWLRNIYSRYTFTNINWHSQRIKAQLARNAELIRVAEFGATIRSQRPIQPGSTLYLRKGLFNKASDGFMCGRFYAVEEADTEEPAYDCSVLYVGIEDSFMKYARKWFRETYALSKKA